MSVYERHPNSIQRTRVVVGEGTWHVRREDGTWYYDTITAAPLDAIATAPTADAKHSGLLQHTHVVPVRNHCVSEHARTLHLQMQCGILRLMWCISSKTAPVVVAAFMSI